MQTYIDFDGTLFNTDKYIKDFMNIFNKYGITEEIFNKEKNNIFNEKELFNINKITDYLIQKYNIDNAIKNKILRLLDKSYVYKEVTNCLKILISYGYELYLLTYGDYKFQKMKIKSSGLSKYFKEIIITEYNKSKLNLDYKNSIFIDNNPSEIERFLKSNAKKTIRIKRASDKYSKINCNILDAAECKDFNEVVKLMKGGL